MAFRNLVSGFSDWCVAVGMFFYDMVPYGPRQRFKMTPTIKTTHDTTNVEMICALFRGLPMSLQNAMTISVTTAPNMMTPATSPICAVIAVPMGFMSNVCAAYHAVAGVGGRRPPPS